MKAIWYNFIRLLIKIGLFFYSKRIKVSGKNNIPKKGAVLFAINHPNGLIDPLIATTNIKRDNYYLVRAASFKKPLVKKILGSLNLMPIYRMRDGASQLGKNQEIFESCFDIFKRGETLMIFPEGSHNKKRTVRLLSKGFTRIVSGALEKHPELEIQVVPVGITYQHASSFPSKVVVRYGHPIATRTIFEANAPAKAINILKAAVTTQLKELSVHIPDDENYDAVLQQLNDAQVDFTQVDQVNKMIESGIFPKPKKGKKNFLKPLLYLIQLNSILPFLIWKTVLKKIDEIEFVDTFRFSLNLVLIPIFYSVQAWILGVAFGTLVGFFYLTISALLILLYAKCAPTNTKSHIELDS